MQSRFLMFFAVCPLWVGMALAQVNINTASQEELDSLKGIGPSRARAIIEYRQQHGPFKSLNELKSIRGMPDSVVSGLRGKASVGTQAPPAIAPAVRRETAASDGSSRPATPALPPRVAVKPAPADGLKMPAPARPAMPGAASGVTQPARTAAPVVEKTSPPTAPAAPAKPALPGKPAAEFKPAAPAAPVVKPAVPAPAMPMARPASPVPAKPAGSATQDAKPAVPARPAAPARPAQPAAAN